MGSAPMDTSSHDAERVARRSVTPEKVNANVFDQEPSEATSIDWPIPPPENRRRTKTALVPTIGEPSGRVAGHGVMELTWRSTPLVTDLGASQRRLVGGVQPVSVQCAGLASAAGFPKQKVSTATTPATVWARLLLRGSPVEFWVTMVVLPEALDFFDLRADMKIVVMHQDTMRARREHLPLAGPPPPCPGATPKPVTRVKRRAICPAPLKLKPQDDPCQSDRFLPYACL